MVPPLAEGDFRSPVGDASGTLIEITTIASEELAMFERFKRGGA